MDAAADRLRFLRVIDGMPFDIEVGPAPAGADGARRPEFVITGGDPLRADWRRVLEHLRHRDPLPVAALIRGRSAEAAGAGPALSFTDDDDGVNPALFASLAEDGMATAFVPRRTLHALVYCLAGVQRRVATLAPAFGAAWEQAFPLAEEDDWTVAFGDSHRQRYGPPVPYGPGAAVLDLGGFETGLPLPAELRELDVQRQDAALLFSLPQRHRQLKVLRLPLLNLTCLPTELTGFAALEALDLPFNALTELPPEIARLARLRRLTLFGNAVARLPPELFELSELRVLDLRHCPLHELPDDIGRLRQLEELHLDACRLERLPDSLGQLSRLRVLTLRGNRLEALPASLARLPALELLDLGYNRFTRIALPGMALGRLRTVFCDGNPLTAVPEFVLGLPALQFLSLRDCRLDGLPPEPPHGWRGLRWLDVGGDDLDDLLEAYR